MLPLQNLFNLFQIYLTLNKMGAICWKMIPLQNLFNLFQIYLTLNKMGAICWKMLPLQNLFNLFQIYLTLNKMGAIRHFQRHFHEWGVLYFNSNFSEMWFKVYSDNKSAFVRVMTWRRVGDKLFPEPMMT